MVQKKKSNLEECTPVVILLSIVAGILVLNLGMWIENNRDLFPSLSCFLCALKGKELDLIVSHASMTFVSISVMSVLSENNMVIYWENVIKEKLIAPPFLCFSSLTIYAFFTLFFAFISYFFKSLLSIFFFYVLDILVLTILSNVMIRVYFGREAKKKNLTNTFCKKASPEEKRIYLDRMQAYTIMAYENGEFDKLMENCQFYGQYTDVKELRFLFDYLFSKETITAFDCNVLEKIYGGLLDNIKERLKSEKEITEEVMLEIYHDLHPIYNSYIRKYFDKCIFYSEENDTEAYGRMEIALLTANFIGDISVLLSDKIFGKILKLQKIDLDDERSWSEVIKKIKDNARKNKDNFKDLPKDKLKLYFSCVKKLVPRNKSNNSDRKFYNKFAEVMFLTLIQLGFMYKENKTETEEIVKVIYDSVSENMQKKFRELVNGISYVGLDAKNDYEIIQNVLLNI